MQDSAAQLRRKIGNASDLQSVVRAMKAQAAASIGQYERSVAALADCTRAIELGLGACFRAMHASEAAARQVSTAHAGVTRAVIFRSDQGLVGRFNEIVTDYARTTLAPHVGNLQVWAVGERARSSWADGRTPVHGTLNVPDCVQAITTLVVQVLTDVALLPERGEPVEAVVQLYLFHNRPSTGSNYAPCFQRLLPLDAVWRRHVVERPWPSKVVPQVLGDNLQTLRALIREHLFAAIFQACAESLASENKSRLAAMERADHNIDTLLQNLHDAFHRERQSAIDAELSDVIAGFKALHETDLPEHATNEQAPRHTDGS